MRAPLAAALGAAALLVATASSGGAQGPADQQLAWVLAALNGAKAPPPAVLRDHFTISFLKAVPPDQIVAALASISVQRPFRLVAVLGRRGSQGLDARIDGRGGTSLKVSIHVTAAGPHLIDGLLFQPIAPGVTSWSAVDSHFAKLAQDASLYAGTANGKAVHSLEATRAGAIGSAFKLYVLGALAGSVQAGTARWNEQLAIHDAWSPSPRVTCATSPPASALPCGTTRSR